MESTGHPRTRSHTQRSNSSAPAKKKIMPTKPRKKEYGIQTRSTAHKSSSQRGVNDSDESFSSSSSTFDTRKRKGKCSEEGGVTNSGDSHKNKSPNWDTHQRCTSPKKSRGSTSKTHYERRISQPLDGTVSVEKELLTPVSNKPPKFGKGTTKTIKSSDQITPIEPQPSDDKGIPTPDANNSYELDMSKTNDDDLKAYFSCLPTDKYRVMCKLVESRPRKSLDDSMVHGRKRKGEHLEERCSTNSDYSRKNISSNGSNDIYVSPKKCCGEIKSASQRSTVAEPQSQLSDGTLPVVKEVISPEGNNSSELGTSASNKDDTKSWSMVHDPGAQQGGNTTTDDYNQSIGSSHIISEALKGKGEISEENFMMDNGDSHKNNSCSISSKKSSGEIESTTLNSPDTTHESQPSGGTLPVVKEVQSPEENNSSQLGASASNKDATESCSQQVLITKNNDSNRSHTSGTFDLRERKGKSMEGRFISNSGESLRNDSPKDIFMQSSSKTRRDHGKYSVMDEGRDERLPIWYKTGKKTRKVSAKFCHPGLSNDDERTANEGYMHSSATRPGSHSKYGNTTTWKKLSARESHEYNCRQRAERSYIQGPDSSSNKGKRFILVGRPFFSLSTSSMAKDDSVQISPKPGFVGKRSPHNDIFAQLNSSGENSQVKHIATNVTGDVGERTNREKHEMQPNQGKDRVTIPGAGSLPSSTECISSHQQASVHAVGSTRENDCLTNKDVLDSFQKRKKLMKHHVTYEKLTEAMENRPLQATNRSASESTSGPFVVYCSDQGINALNDSATPLSFTAGYRSPTAPVKIPERSGTSSQTDICGRRDCFHADGKFAPQSISIPVSNKSGCNTYRLVVYHPIPSAQTCSDNSNGEKSSSTGQYSTSQQLHPASDNCPDQISTTKIDFPRQFNCPRKRSTGVHERVTTYEIRVKVTTGTDGSTSPHTVEKATQTTQCGLQNIQTPGHTSHRSTRAQNDDDMQTRSTRQSSNSRISVNDLVKDSDEDSTPSSPRVASSLPHGAILTPQARDVTTTVETPSSQGKSTVGYPQ